MHKRGTSAGTSTLDFQPPGLQEVCCPSSGSESLVLQPQVTATSRPPGRAGLCPVSVPCSVHKMCPHPSEQKRDSEPRKGRRVQPTGLGIFRPAPRSQGTALSPHSQGTGPQGCAGITLWALLPGTPPALTCDLTWPPPLGSGRSSQGPRPQRGWKRVLKPEDAGPLRPAPASRPVSLKIRSLFCLPKVKGPSLPIIKMHIL